MPVPIAPMIPIAAELLINLINAARSAKELKEQDLQIIKDKLEIEFANIPTWDEL